MDPADPLLGTRVGNYRLAYVLGEGGMGRVYAAIQPQIAGRIAIKVLSSQSPDLVARFFAEARAVNLIKHPSIVKVYDLSHLPDGRPYIMMELVEGETLRAVVRRDPALPIGGVLRVMCETLGALAAAHAIGIVHRDVKSDNVMVTLDGGAKVLDFGIAKLSPWLGGAMPRTQTGARIGTPAYMAPEQIRGSGVDARTDVYAAGVVLFEAVTGVRPFRGDNEFELMKGHLEEAPPSPRTMRPELSPELEGVILQALAKHPDRRFQTATAMANALAHVIATLPPDQRRMLVPRATPTAELPGPTSQPPTIAAGSRRRPQVATAGAQAERSQAATAFERLPGSGVAAADRPSSSTARRRWLVAAALVVPTAIAGIVMVATNGGADRPPGSAAASTAETASERASVPSATAPGATAPIVETLPSGGKRATKPIDFDPARFDHIAYLPKAQEFARTLISDAELVSLVSDAVRADGSAELSPPASNIYTFVSVSQARSPSSISRLCVVAIRVTTLAVEATANPLARCDVAPSRHPTCSFAQVWARARAKGVRTDAVAMINWSSNQWLLLINAVGHARVSLSLDDRCNGTSGP